jgi:outer membrane protein OmpA-like peptidoglycan-associated protein
MLRALAAWLLVLATTSYAEAQAVELDQYRAAPTARDGFMISRPVGLGHLRPSASLQLDYALAPLVLETPRGIAAELASHQLTGQLSLALGIFDRFVAFARLPVVLVFEGESAEDFPRADGAGLGDLALGARARLYGEDGEPFALALELEATVPTAAAASGQQQLSGEASMSFTPRVLAEVRPHRAVSIQASVGARFREQAVFRGLTVGHELTWGLGAGVWVVEDLLEARVETWGRTSLEDFGMDQVTPAEVFLGARLVPIEGLVVGLGGGFGIGRGYGTPAFRGALTVAWVGPSLDGSSASGSREAIVDPVMRQTRVAEPAEPGERGATEGANGERAGEGGTPGSSGNSIGAGQTTEPAAGLRYGELDRDGDRISDANDRCPLDREDFDEIQDEDGCPEEDADLDRLVDPRDRCPLTAGSQTDPDCAGCPEHACMARSGGAIEISERVEFETGSDVILPESEAVLRDVASIVGTNAQIVRIRIEGHTDDVGDDADNMELSRRRAASVMRWMTAHGIDAVRIEAWGCGEMHALGSNARASGRRANRRVEFIIVEPPTAQAIHAGCQRAEPGEER